MIEDTLILVGATDVQSDKIIGIGGTWSEEYQGWIVQPWVGYRRGIQASMISWLASNGVSVEYFSDLQGE